MKKNNCNIIKDILPLYVDEVVTEDTSEFIHNHLTQCESCRKEYEQMKKTIFVPIEKDTKPLKNIKRKWTRKAFKVGMIASVIAVIITSILLESANKKQFTMKSIPELQEEAENLKDVYDNLNLSDTVISIPDVDKMDELVFPLTYTLQDQTEKFEDNIRKYAGLDENTDLTPYMSIAYWDRRENDRLVIPYSEATEEQLEQIQYLCYNDGQNSELLLFSNYMLEMGNYELPTALTGDIKDYSDNSYGYRGIGLGIRVDSYYLPEDDISEVSYTLADGNVALKDAVAYVEKHVKEDYYFVGSELLDYHAYKVDVRQLNDSVYYYEFCLSPTYQGIPLNKNHGVSPYIEEEKRLSERFFGDAHKVSMFCSDQLGFIWSSCHSYEKVEIPESHSEFISLDDACSLLSNYLSEKMTYFIKSIELIYQTEFRYESQEKMDENRIASVCCHPVYRFSVKNSSYIFEVDAITGQVMSVVR